MMSVITSLQNVCRITPTRSAPQNIRASTSAGQIRVQYKKQVASFRQASTAPFQIARQATTLRANNLYVCAAGNGGSEQQHRVIKCDSKYVSQVIGPKGATIKALQTDSGAKVDIIRNEETDCHDISVTGTMAQTAAAVSAIELIIANAEDPDYEGDEGKSLRAEAQRFYDERSKCNEQKQAAFDAGDKDKGHTLVKEASELGKKAEDANAKAANAIFKFNNDGKGDMYIDLHGLKVEEATGKLKQRLEDVTASPEGTRVMEVMPGAGNHSGADGPKIKGECANILTDMKLKFEDKSAGSWNVNV